MVKTHAWSFQGIDGRVDTRRYEVQDFTPGSTGNNGVPVASAVQEILYIEDNPINLKLISAIVARMENIHLHSVPEPKSGIEMAAAKNPDLILLDINLPGMHGYDVFRALRAMEATRHIPVIAISANAMEEDIRHAIELGFAEYIVKPIKIDNFIQTITRYLAN